MRQVNWPLLALFVVVWLILGQLFMGHAVHLVWALEGTILEFRSFEANFFVGIKPRKRILEINFTSIHLLVKRQNFLIAPSNLIHTRHYTSSK